jgi:3-oxoacyl-ACP reductase-like protein
MGIFSKIKDAIFGKKAVAAEPKPAIPLEAAPAAPAAAAAPAAPTAITEVDVEAILAQAASESGEDLNWRTSIVDLMKLLDIDSSYANRKELAVELGDADYSGTAEENIALHKKVMQELAKNGGKVPAALTD